MQFPGSLLLSALKMTRKLIQLHCLQWKKTFSDETIQRYLELELIIFER